MGGKIFINCSMSLFNQVPVSTEYIYSWTLMDSRAGALWLCFADGFAQESLKDQKASKAFPLLQHFLLLQLLVN